MQFSAIQMRINRPIIISGLICAISEMVGPIAIARLRFKYWGLEAFFDKILAKLVQNLHFETEIFTAMVDIHTFWTLGIFNIFLLRNYFSVLII